MAAGTASGSTTVTSPSGICRKRLPELPERGGVAAAGEAVAALGAGRPRQVLAGEGLGDLARDLLAALDERHARQRAPQQALHHGVVGAAEDDRVDAGGGQRGRVLAHHRHDLVVEGVAALDRRGQARAGDAGHLDAGVVGVDHARVGARADRRLGGQQADAPVAGGLDGRVGLGPHHADQRASPPPAGARGAPTAVAVLQATTISFTPCASSQRAMASARRRSSSTVFSPYGKKAVSPK